MSLINTADLCRRNKSAKTDNVKSRSSSRALRKIIPSSFRRVVFDFLSSADNAFRESSPTMFFRNVERDSESPSPRQTNGTIVEPSGIVKLSNCLVALSIKKKKKHSSVCVFDPAPRRKPMIPVSREPDARISSDMKMRDAMIRICALFSRERSNAVRASKLTFLCPRSHAEWRRFWLGRRTGRENSTRKRGNDPRFLVRQS